MASHQTLRWWSRWRSAAIGTDGTVLGAATPAEGYRRLVSKQEAGWLIVGGSRSGTTGVHHQVHPTEEAEAEGWEQQMNWKWTTEES